METHVSNVEVTNEYQAVAEPNKDQLQLSDEDTPITKGTNRINPPPIIIQDKKNWPAISQLLRNSKLKSDKNFNDKDGIKIMETYEKCLQTLEHHKVDHFPFKKESDNEIKELPNNLRLKTSLMTLNPRDSIREWLHDLKTEMVLQCHIFCAYFQNLIKLLRTQK
ncbi:hypothetical protein JTB14_005878 [Gonioctena quinquepunctata]|nr:hypothetical protein JTB14_005878 [Gonioctena quinquepunctata]